MSEPDPVRPPLTRWGHTWRLVACVAISAVAWAPVAGWQAEQHRGWLVLDLCLGVACLALAQLRRRQPLPVALLTSAATAVSGASAGPALLAAVSLATHRRWRWLVVLGLVALPAAQTWVWLIRGVNDDPMWLLTAANVVGFGAVVGWGMYVGSRRELLWTLRTRAERAEAEQELRVARSRSNERARIAREMHDVLAHRISQISMQAGALSYRDDLDAAQLRSGTALIQQQAHEALTDLRGVLGVLRDADGAVLDAPQPTYADVAGLVEQARAAGLRVEHADTIEPSAGPPDVVGRTVYRIVQEGITNVRKHAPGAPLGVQLWGTPESGVSVRLCNRLGFAGSPAAAAGAGLGLVGLAERAALGGGHLAHGRRDGVFEVEAWLPWAP